MRIDEQIKADFQKVFRKLKLPSTKIVLEHPKDPKNGDFSTNWALQQAKKSIGKIQQTPFEIAKNIVENFPRTSYLAKTEVAPPGFINFFLKESVFQDEVGEIVKKGEDYVRLDVGHNQKVSVEFISANPTGPLHIGNARGGPLGDVIANVLDFSGFKVSRDYYHNDVGSQVEKFGQSIANVAAGKDLADQEYKGEYILELAQKIPQAKDSKIAAQKGVEMILGEILADCQKMGIDYDHVYQESELLKVGKTKEVIEILKEKGVTRSYQGALWFAPKDEFLEDRQSVLIRSNGEPTYFANDIALHQEKLKKGNQLLIDILGSTHHGHVPRMQAAIQALGFDPTKLKIVLYQFVRVKRGKEVVKMSKRAGNFVTAHEVLTEVGKDAFRFFMLMHDSNTHLDFDLKLAKKKSQENPVYYVQYAHARIASILRKVSSINYQVSSSRQIDYSLLKTDYELALIRKLIRLPELVEEISKTLAVHQLTTYAIDLADSFHRFYENCQVLGKDQKLSKTRLQLVLATGIILRTTLKLLGITAPQQM